MWNPKVSSIHSLVKGAQFLHYQVSLETITFMNTLCYTFNDYFQRRDLWKMVGDYSLQISTISWIVFGDFNGQV